MIGKEELHEWFGLSRASFLTLPRVMMQEMPDEWQQKMADLLQEYEATYRSQPEDMSTRVQITNRRGMVVKTPEWVVNYRHPDLKMIKKLKTYIVKCRACSREFKTMYEKRFKLCPHCGYSE